MSGADMCLTIPSADCGADVKPTNLRRHQTHRPCTCFFSEFNLDLTSWRRHRQKLQVPNLLQRATQYADSFPGPRLIKPIVATGISRPGDGYGWCSIGCRYILRRVTIIAVRWLVPGHRLKNERKTEQRRLTRLPVDPRCVPRL